MTIAASDCECQFQSDPCRLLTAFRVPTASKDFVYTTSSSRTKRLSDSELILRQTHRSSENRLYQIREIESDHDENVLSSEDAEPGDPLCSPSSLFSLKSFSLMRTIPEAHRALLDHFINVTTVSISCHRGIQNELCSTIMPMAFEVPHLLTAVLALAAAHRQSANPNQEDQQFGLLQGHSLKQLRSALSRFDPKENDQVLATILIMCVAEIIVPSTTDTSVWRSHLHGAATLSAQQWFAKGAGGSSTSSLLRRKYQALQAVALACGFKRYDGCILATPVHNNVHIDDLAGYSTRLLPIFKEINDLDLIRETSGSDFFCDQEPGPPHFDCNSLLEHQSHLLFDRIVALMAERNISELQKDGVFPSVVSQDLYRLDEAYHHMAILQVFRRGSLSVPLQLIDDSRGAILTCLSAMEYEANPCPGVAALPPLFVAGSLCSNTADKQKVRRLLKTMWMRYSMGNVRQCRVVLERWWKEQDERTSAKSMLADGSGGTKEYGLDDLSAFLWTVGEHDVLPY